MGKKYNGGWGIRVRKNVIENANLNDAYIWLNSKFKLDSVDNANRYKSRDEAYEVLNNDCGHFEILIDPNENIVIDCNDFAVDKLPIKSSERFGIQDRSGKWLNDYMIFGNKGDALLFNSYEEALEELREEDGEYITPITDTPPNPNPDRPWDIIFDRPSIVYEESENLATAQRQPDHVIPGFTYKKVDIKTKDGKKLLELICKLIGI